MMKINSLDEYPISHRFLNTDKNNRTIKIYQLQNVIPVGKSLYYPNILFYTLDNKPTLYNPIEEKVMSLKDVKKDETLTVDIVNKKYVNNNNDYFFFVYNTDNYFHFIYDTLPYLITFLKLRESLPNIKLLMNLPNEDKKEFYTFVIESLKILGITNNDIEIIDENCKYEKVYISNSYTHGIDSNLPPRNEIYSLYQNMVKNIKLNIDTPKKIYVSRRSWVHGDFSNIGTNYTTRRKMVNEDELVELLTEYGYVEVFPETMSMIEKITLFNNADKVIGAFGGGICNVVFSKPECELIAIASPNFLSVNERFKFSLNQIKLNIFNNVRNVETSEFKTYMRVKYNEIIGEIVFIDKNKLTISYSDTPIAGWNNEVKYKTITVDSKYCEKLDEGLNSPWEIDLDKFKEKYL